MLLLILVYPFYVCHYACVCVCLCLCVCSICNLKRSSRSAASSIKLLTIVLSLSELTFTLLCHLCACLSVFNVCTYVCVCVCLSRFKLDISISIELIVDTTSVKLNIKRSSHHYIKHCAALFTPHEIIILPTLPRTAPFPHRHPRYTLRAIVKHALHSQVNTMSVINSVWTIIYAIKNAHYRVYIAIDIGKQIKVIIVY